MKQSRELSDRKIVRKLWTFSDGGRVVTIAPAIVRELHLDDTEVYCEETITDDGCILLRPRRLLG
jgi:hypothetical protein